MAAPRGSSPRAGNKPGERRSARAGPAGRASGAAPGGTRGHPQGAAASGRAAELVRLLGLGPHPEGGSFREIFRSPQRVVADDDRGPRAALTSIDFVLAAGEFSAWHRVASDEAWHLLEGGPLRLWLAPPAFEHFTSVDLAPASESAAPRHVVAAGWWQAAEALGDYAYVGATVGPGFDFADFGFGRDDDALREALGQLAPALVRLL